MAYTRQRSRRAFVSLTPEIHGIKGRRVMFSILNVIIVTAIIIILAMTIVAIL